MRCMREMLRVAYSLSPSQSPGLILVTVERPEVYKIYYLEFRVHWDASWGKLVEERDIFLPMHGARGTTPVSWGLLALREAGEQALSWVFSWWITSAVVFGHILPWLRGQWMLIRWRRCMRTKIPKKFASRGFEIRPVCQQWETPCGNIPD